MNTVHRAPALRKMALSTGVGCFTVSHISIIVINFLFWLCWVTAALWAFLWFGGLGLLSSCGAGASLLQAPGPARGLRSHGSQALEHRLDSCVTRA